MAKAKEMPVIVAGKDEGLEDTHRPKIDFARLTLGEVDKIETLSGQPITALNDDQAPKGRLIAAMVFVASRRYGEPKTWDQCLAMEAPDASAYVGMDDEADDDGTEALEDDEGKDSAPTG